MKKGFLLIFYCLFTSLLAAQTQYKWTHYWSGSDFSFASEGDYFWTAQLHGLSRQNLRTGETKYFRPNVIQADSASNFVIRDIVIAQNGIKWLATNQGLVRFDDKRNDWQYINPNPNNPIANNIRVDKNGNIWWLENLSTSANGESYFVNLYCYSPQQNRRIQSVRVDAGAFEIDSNNIIWLANNRFIRKFDGNTITVVAANDVLKNGSLLSIDHQNNIWFGGRRNSGFIQDSSFLYRYDGRNLTSFRMPFPVNAPQEVHLKIGIDTLNQVYLTTNKDIYRFDGSQWTIVNRNFPPSDGKSFYVFDGEGRPVYRSYLNVLGNLYVTDSFVKAQSADRMGVFNFNLYEDKNGNKWFLSQSGTEYTKMIDSATFKYYKWPFRLGMSDRATETFQDSAKNFWCFRQEVLRFNDTTPTILLKFDGTRFDSIAMPRQGNTRVVLAKFAVSNPTNRVIAQLFFSEPNSTNTAVQVMEFRNNVWVRLDSSITLVGSEYLSVDIDSKHNVWYQKLNDVQIMDKQGGIKTLQSLNPPFNNSVMYSRFHDRKGNTWIMKKNEGLIYKYNGINWQTITTLRDSIRLLDIQGITDDAEGNIWLASALASDLPIPLYTTGLSKYDGRKWTRWLKNETEFMGGTKIYVDKDKLVWLDYGNGFRISTFKENGVERRVNTVDLDNPFAESIVFPNPMTEEATIVLKSENTERVLSKGILSIFDVNGKLICQKNFEDNKVTIHRNELPQSGLYIYRVTKDGKFSVGKILVQ